MTTEAQHVDDDPTTADADAALAEAQRLDAEAETRAEFVHRYTDGLRQMADFLDEHPTLVPGGSVGMFLWHNVWDLDELAGLIRTLGKSDKFEDEHCIGVDRTFGPHRIRLAMYRSVSCTQVDTGEVKQRTIVVEAGHPIPPDARRIATKTVAEYVVDEPVMAWECPPSLLAGAGGES